MAELKENQIFIDVNKSHYTEKAFVDYLIFGPSQRVSSILQRAIFPEHSALLAPASGANIGLRTQQIL